MQPSPVEIQREVEALRDIRRRSTAQGGPGSLVLDPDLPIEPSPTSPSGYWTSGTNPGLTDGDSSSSSHEDGSSSERSSADDPFHLFWVPARLHPEIAPTEFRAFLKEHARNPPVEGAVGLSRSASAASVSSSGLGRRTSLLSRQYRPSEGDGSEDEHVVPLRRNRSSIYNPGPQLTIDDLQKLDQLAEEASANDDPTKLRSILRRSLSLNVAPSAMDTMDNIPDMGEDADAPIIVPRPGQILRRAARTKIRKPGLPGDGGGHRFGQSTRRQTTGTARTASTTEQRTSSDMSSSDHGESPESPQRGRVFSGESLSDEPTRSPPVRPDSYTEEASSIFDAYVQGEPEEDNSRTEAPTPTDSHPSRVVVTSPPPPASIELPLSLPLPQPPLPAASEPTPIPIPPAFSNIHQPQPQRATLRPPTQEPIRATSPESLRSAEGATTSRSYSPGSETSSFISTSPIPKKEKDKKGLFGFGRDKSSKKAAKEKEREKEQRERAEREREEEKKKEKEGGFFGSLFGGKKKQDESATHAGRDTAATPGASKSSRSYVSPMSPQFSAADGSYARYPIHVERAIYRLSHIKLANPRRPLYEQVLISNLMFWYLGVINKTQSPGSPGSGQQQQPQGNSSTADSEREREQEEAEEHQKAEKEKERMEKEKEREREQQQKKEVAPRRGSLTKSASAGAPAGRRAAEMPVRGPQYEMQHRVMEQEYGGLGSGPSQPMPVRSGMPLSMSGGPLRSSQPANADVYHNSGGNQQRTPQLQLPPGAMAPMSSNQMPWLSSSTATPPPKSSHRPSSPPSPPHAVPANQDVSEAFPAARRSRSPPQHNQNRFAPSPIHMPDLYTAPSPVVASNPPSRSRSATATNPPTQLSPPTNGKLRKNMSAQAVMANGRKPRRSDTAPNSPTGEEEDVPLAVWQQQRRR